MLTADERRALAGRLRAFVDGADLYYDDLLAAADELERARPRVTWSLYRSTGASDAKIRPFGIVWHGSVRDRRLLQKRRDSWIAAGFDVAPLPEVPRDDR